MEHMCRFSPEWFPNRSMCAADGPSGRRRVAYFELDDLIARAADPVAADPVAAHDEDAPVTE